MELGLGLNDCDFIEKVKQKHAPLSYNAKVCYSEWFLSDKADNGINDMATVYKFRGDYNYQRKDFESAIACFEQSLDRLGEHNRTMRRELIESQVRCNMRTGQFIEALQFVEYVMNDCSTIDNFCHVLLLQQQLYRYSGDILRELGVLHQLISIYPDNAQFWLKLAELYEKIKNSLQKTSTDSNPNCTDGKVLKPDTVNTQKEKDDLQNIASENLKECFCTNTMSKAEDDKGCSKQTSVQDITTECSIANLEISNSKIVRTACTCEEKTKQALSGYSIELVLLTCYYRARLKLLSVQGTVGSFIRDRNKVLVDLIDSKIGKLSVNERTIENVTQFVRQEMSEEDSEEPGKKEHNHDVKTIMKNRISFQDFNTQWFSWIKDTS